jgi:ABC-type antimicrobial peptide transport system permease subunit
MEQVVVDDVAGDFAVIGLMAYFTLVALGLAAAGIDAVVSHSVSERSREIGIRMAIGAKAGEVLTMVVRQGMLPVAAGLVVGAAASLGLTRVMGSMLYGVSPADPATYLATTAILVSVALAAILLPALRAAKTDPVSVLRSDG